uniref:Tektin-1 n=1 Tax=Timema californicum TaxID=61474 RepID=A0A7R9JBS7_TIMCA|nr:unnamed protein product [Timema californicum]
MTCALANYATEAVYKMAETQSLVIVPPPPARFTLTEWGLNNRRRYRLADDQQQLAERLIAESDRVREVTEEVTKLNKTEVDKKLRERITDIEFLKEENEKQKTECCLEEEALNTYKERLLDAIESLKENALKLCNKCIILREGRIGIDLCHDDVEKELVKEVQTIEDAQSLLMRALEQTKEQTRLLRSTKYFLDRDHQNKGTALKIDRQCEALQETSLNLSMYHGNAPLNPGNVTNDEWNEFCRKNIDRAAKEINNARPLRAYINTLLKQVIDDLWRQYHITNDAFKIRIEDTRRAKDKLEREHYELKVAVSADVGMGLMETNHHFSEKHGVFADRFSIFQGPCYSIKINKFTPTPTACDYMQLDKSRITDAMCHGRNNTNIRLLHNVSEVIGHIAKLKRNDKNSITCDASGREESYMRLWAHWRRLEVHRGLQYLHWLTVPEMQYRVREWKITGYYLGTVHKVNDMMRNITKLEKAIAEKEGFMSLAHTRLGNRAHRPEMELCRDEVEAKLVAEVQQLGQNVTALQEMLAELIQAIRFYDDHRTYYIIIKICDDMQHTSCRLAGRCVSALGNHIITTEWGPGCVKSQQDITLCLTFVERGCFPALTGRHVMGGVPDARAQASLRYLLRVQIQLEEDINIKINSLKIDEVDCMTIRQAMDYHAY